MLGSKVAGMVATVNSTLPRFGTVRDSAGNPLLVVPIVVAAEDGTAIVPPFGSVRDARGYPAQPVVVYPVDSSGAYTSLTNSGTDTTPAPAFTQVSTVSGDGPLVLGVTLTAAGSTVNNGSVTARQWLRNGLPISGATGASYHPVTSGAYSCRETATGPTGKTASSSTLPVNVAAQASGSVFTFDTAVIRSGQTYTFTVRRAGGDNTKAESANFTLGPSETYQVPATGAELAGVATATANFNAGSDNTTISFTVPATVQPE